MQPRSCERTATADCRRRSFEAEGDDQRLIELGESGRPKATTAASEHLLGEGEDVVAVRGALAVEALVRSQPDLSNMTVKRAGHEHAHDSGQQWERCVSRHDHDRMGSDAWDRGIPDVTARDQCSLAARHAATENAESFPTSSSASGVGTE